MILQRNISQLSNRLAAGGGLRIREDVLERDYCLAWFLNAVAESDLRPALAFKGGTALKRCYFADYRFSEDLDFTLRQALPFEEIRTRLERVYATAQQQRVDHAFNSKLILFGRYNYSPSDSGTRGPYADLSTNELLSTSVHTFTVGLNQKTDTLRRSLAKTAFPATQYTGPWKMTNISSGYTWPAAWCALLDHTAAGSNSQRPEFGVQVEGIPRNLHPILRDEVYRITGEAMRNAFRHSDAKQIEVEIHYDERRVRVRVRDDGKGIDPKLLSDDGREGHFGLRGMRERAKLIGGKLTVWSELDSGTEVELSIPASRAYTVADGQKSWLAEKFAKLSGKDTELKS